MKKVSIQTIINFRFGPETRIEPAEGMHNACVDADDIFRAPSNSTAGNFTKSDKVAYAKLVQRLMQK
jgi:hypothetical protein